MRRLMAEAGSATELNIWLAQERQAIAQERGKSSRGRNPGPQAGRGRRASRDAPVKRYQPTPLRRKPKREPTQVHRSAMRRLIAEAKTATELEIWLGLERQAIALEQGKSSRGRPPEWQYIDRQLYEAMRRGNNGEPPTDEQFRAVSEFLWDQALPDLTKKFGQSREQMLERLSDLRKLGGPQPADLGWCETHKFAFPKRKRCPYCAKGVRLIPGN